MQFLIEKGKCQMKQIIKYGKEILYYAIPFAILIWCSQMIFSDSIWLDEAFSLSLVEQSFTDIIKNTAIDVHPPLYYLLLKIILSLFHFLGIHHTILIAKFTSLIPMGLLLVVSYTKIAKLFGKKTAFLFNLLLLGMPQLMFYSIEIRMYSFAFLFVTLFYLSFLDWKIENSTKSLFKMTIFSILCFYTHYFAGVTVACFYLFLLVEYGIKKDLQRLKSLVFSIFLTILLYLPWLIILIRQILCVRENYWIEAITFDTIKSFIQYPYTINSSKILTTIIGCFILLSLFPGKGIKNGSAIYGFLAPLGTILVGVTVSLLLRPIFISRYMVCSLACLWLAVSIKLAYFFKKDFFFFILVLIVLVTTLCTNYKIIANERYYKEEELKLIDTLHHIDIEHSCIIFDSHQLQRIIAYYEPTLETYSYVQPITQLTKQVYVQTNMQLLENLNLEELSSKTVYLFCLQENLLKEVDNLNYEYEKDGDYQIEMYRFSIYKLK